jgi:uncharacterized coiled-coil DUF342 family protein
MNGDKKLIAIAKEHDRDASGDDASGTYATGTNAADDTVPVSESAPQTAFHEDENLQWEDPRTDFDEWDLADTERRSRRHLMAWRAIFGLLALGWSGFFVWSVYQRGLFPSPPSVAIDLVVQWAVPVILLAAVYLLIMRNSTTEAQKFARITRSLSDESSLLEERLTTINSELSLAREFLANQARELDSLGRVSTERLMQHGEALRAVIEGSDSKMRVIGEVSEASTANMEKLRSHLPVIANAAKDVTNQIGNAGRTAQNHVTDLQNAFSQLNDDQIAAGQNIDTLRDKADHISQTLAEIMERFNESIAQNNQTISQAADNNAQHLLDHAEALQSNLQAIADTLEAKAETARQVVSTSTDSLDKQIADIIESTAQADQRLAAIMTATEQHLDNMNSRLNQYDEDGGAKIARLAFALSAVDEDLARLTSHLTQEDGRAAEFLQTAENLLSVLQASHDTVTTQLPEALDDLNTNTEVAQTHISGLQRSVTDIFDASDGFTDKMVELGQSLAMHQKYLTDMADESGEYWSKRNDDILQLTSAIREAREEAQQLAEMADTRLVESLRDIQQHARDTRDDIRSTLEKLVSDMASSLSSQSAEALESIVRGKAEEIVGKLESAITRAVSATGDATLHLRDQLVKVDDLTSHLERRVTQARERAEEDTDTGFARRVALLNESLNSTSIDIAKIMDREVSDTGWAAYLKGDRGIFTRRAVRLLSNSEAREIGQFYENDEIFYEQVNRYIHDFEAMLRSVMSTRDGSVMGVTLLSSDMGKLYVALAQAIERFRK